jgi:hypothetical protein
MNEGGTNEGGILNVQRNLFSCRMTESQNHHRDTERTPSDQLDIPLRVSVVIPCFCKLSKSWISTGEWYMNEDGMGDDGTGEDGKNVYGMNGEAMADSGMRNSG